MQRSISIILYGSPSSQALAKALLENMPEVKRDSEYDHHLGGLRLILYNPIKETSLIPLLRQSGIHGFRLVDN